MDNKNKATIIASLALMVAIGAGTIGMGLFADAHPDGSNGFGRNLISDEQKTEIQEMHEQMEQAIENNDYEAWKNIIDSRPRISDAITEENFSKFAEMHNLMQDGKFDEAQAIRDELGFAGFRRGVGQGFQGRGMMRGTQRGQNGGGFLDKNKDGICDHMQQ